MKGLARDRAQRYQTAGELQRDLEAFARRAELNLSDLAMSRLMTELFATELEQLQREARDTGLTLDEVFATKTIREHQRRAPRRRWLPPAIVLGLFVAGYAIARWVMAG